MTSCKSGLLYRALPVLLTGAICGTLFFSGVASGQSAGTIDAGTTITVRTNEQINAGNSDGRVFSGVVDQEVINRSGNVAIPRGANVEMLVKTIARNQIALDLESVTVNGERYGIQTLDSVVSSQQPDGFGANKRTGEFLGGGAVIGAIIGAIAGGGKGAAIGGGLGAAAGAGTQVHPGQKRECSGRVPCDVSFATTAANGSHGRRVQPQRATLSSRLPHEFGLG